jgi:hypothetical protein
MGQVERGRLRDRVGRSERQGRDGRRRHVVDDDPSRTRQQRQEGLGHAVGAEEVDSEVLVERGTIAQVIVKRDAGVVDEDIERADLAGGCLAFGLYAWNDKTQTFMPRAVDVLTLRGAQILQITAFLTPDAFRGFDFPAVLPESGTNS